MANVGTFPLLNLPYLPLANVIQQFDFIRQRVYLATLSRRTAILVKSLRDIKVLGLNLTVSNSLKMLIIYLDHGRVSHLGWIYNQDPNTSEFPFLVDYNNLQKLIYTVFFIFTLSGFEELVVRWAEDGTLKMSRLQNLLRNVNTIKFERIYSNKFYKEALAMFPSVRHVSMTGKPNDQLLTNQLEILELGSLFYVPVLVNCESLQLPNSILTWKELNQFMKCWTQGSLPRLKHVRMRYLPPMHQDLIFKGIKYWKADQKREITFKCYSLKLEDPRNTVVQGGVDIKNKIGVRATVTIKNERQRFASWNMNVWD